MSDYDKADRIENGTLHERLIEKGAITFSDITDEERKKKRITAISKRRNATSDDLNDLISLSVSEKMAELSTKHKKERE